MAGGTVNASKYLKRQGIDPHMVYEAKVINNNDERKLCRIQARIKGIFDGISDADLPWAVPEYKHPDGAYNRGGDSIWKAIFSDHSGMVWIPKNDHKVGLKFPTGDPHRPVWTNYCVDEEVKIPEGDVNYPDRAVFKFSNGCYMIIDTRTNEIFINNPGDVNVTILGDLNMTVVGNQTQTVSSRKPDIPNYLLNAPQTALNLLKQNPFKKISYIGLLSKGYSGNSHNWVTGDQTNYIEGNRKTVIDGNDILIVKRNRLETIALLHRIEATRSETNG